MDYLDNISSNFEIILTSMVIKVFKSTKLYLMCFCGRVEGYLYVCMYVCMLYNVNDTNTV